jgi:hypothetical protein
VSNYELTPESFARLESIEAAIGEICAHHEKFCKAWNIPLRQPITLAGIVESLQEEIARGRNALTVREVTRLKPVENCPCSLCRHLRVAELRPASHNDGT